MPERNSGRLRFPECSGVAREGRGEGTVGRRPRWVAAAAAAAIVPAPRVSVGASAPGRGLGPWSRALGPSEPPLPVSGRPPPPHRRPEAARGRGHVSRGSASRRSSEAAAGGNTERASQAPIRPYRVNGGCTGLRGGRAFFSLVQTTRMGLSGPRPVWPSPACPSPTSSAGRLRDDPSPTSCRSPAKDPGMGKRHPARSGVSIG